MSNELRRFALVLLVLSVAPSVALADGVVALARLEGDGRGLATAALRRALTREGVRVVDEDSAYRVEGRISRGRLALVVVGPDGDESFEVRGQTINELARRGAERIAPLLGPAGDPAREPERTPAREEARAPVPDTPMPPRNAEAPREGARGHRPAAAPSALRNAQTALAFDLAFTEQNRDLVFKDDVFSRLSDYHARFAPALRLSFEWFPAAHKGARSPLAWIGVGASYDRVFGYSSRSADGTTSFPTRASSYDVDVRYRIPLGFHAITAMVGYGRESFYVDGSGPTTPTSGQAPAVPSTNYGYVRIGGDAYLRVAGGLYFGTSAGLRILDHRGGLDAWFPDNRGAGIDLGARLTYHVGAALRLGLAADYHRYVFGLNPSPGDFYVAGGAHDNFLRVSLFVGVRMPELR